MTADRDAAVELLEEELETIRRRGYAVNGEELIEGYRSIGAAVTSPGGDVLGAFTVGGPTYRMAVDDESTEAISRLLLDEVDALKDDVF